MDIQFHAKLRRITAALLVTVLLSGVLSGCNQDNPVETSAQPPQVTETEAQTIPPTTAPLPESIGATVTADELNVRKGVGISFDIVHKLYKGDRVEILEQQDLNGIMWGRIAQGWICLEYVHIDGAPMDAEPGEEERVLEQPAVGTVIATELNVRTGPGTNYAVSGSLLKDDKVTITEVKGNWGKTANGWINIIFAYFPDSLDTVFMETKVNADELNVRSGPSVSYESLRKVNTGDPVTIWKFVTINNIQWGYIGDGWICMKYVEQAPLYPND